MTALAFPAALTGQLQVGGISFALPFEFLSILGAIKPVASARRNAIEPVALQLSQLSAKLDAQVKHELKRLRFTEPLAAEAHDPVRYLANDRLRSPLRGVLAPGAHAS